MDIDLASSYQDHQKDHFLSTTDFGLKESERRYFPNDNMFYENKNMGKLFYLYYFTIII
jgi:hypothetical protein